MTNPGTATPLIACDLSGVTDQQRARQRIAAADVLAMRSEVRRDEDHWTVEFRGGVRLATLAEFLEFERRCCAFLEFNVRVRGLSVCLELGGPEGSAALIQELFPIVRPA